MCNDGKGKENKSWKSLNKIMKTKKNYWEISMKRNGKRKKKVVKMLKTKFKIVKKFEKNIVLFFSKIEKIKN